MPITCALSPPAQFLIGYYGPDLTSIENHLVTFPLTSKGSGMGCTFEVVFTAHNPNNLSFILTIPHFCQEETKPWKILQRFSREAGINRELSTRGFIRVIGKGATPTYPTLMQLPNVGAKMKRARY